MHVNSPRPQQANEEGQRDAAVADAPHSSKRKCYPSSTIQSLDPQAIHSMALWIRYSTKVNVQCSTCNVLRTKSCYRRCAGHVSCKLQLFSLGSMESRMCRKCRMSQKLHDWHQLRARTPSLGTDEPITIAAPYPSRRPSLPPRSHHFTVSRAPCL